MSDTRGNPAAKKNDIKTYKMITHEVRGIRHLSLNNIFFIPQKERRDLA